MEEFEDENEDAGSSKDWLAPTNNFLSQLKDVKKSYYRLGGGPREREVDCRCNYRTQKNSSHFLSLEPEPPQLSTESQETASTDITVSDLVQQCHKHVADNKPVINKRQRPPSASVGQRPVPNQDTEQPNTSSGGFNRVFIAVKGQTVQPHRRPDSASRPSGGGVGAVDDQSIDSVQQATLDDLVKFSAAFAYTQDNEPLPPPPCSSPDLLEDSDNSFIEGGSNSEEDNTSYSHRYVNGGSNMLHDLEESPESVENLSERSTLRNREKEKVPMEIPKASNMVFAIPTGDDDSDENFSEDEITGARHNRNDMPLGESLEKADKFMNTLEKLKKVEKSQINKCVTNINKITLAMGTIDLNSVQGDDLEGRGDSNPGRPISRLSMHRPPSSRMSSTALKVTQRRGSDEEVEVCVPNEDCNVAVDDTDFDEEFGNDELIESFSKYDGEPMWVEEPSVPIIKVKTQNRLGFVGTQTDPKKKIRPSSGKILRRESEPILDDGYLVQGKTIEFIDATDLLARRPMAYTKPVRPPSAPQPVTKRHSMSDLRPDPHRLDQNPGDMSVQVKISGRPPKPARPTSAWTSRPKSGQRLRLGSAKKTSPTKQEEDSKNKECKENEKHEMQTLSEPLSAMSALTAEPVLAGKGLKKTVSFTKNLSVSESETADPKVEKQELKQSKVTTDRKQTEAKNLNNVKAPEDPYIAIQDGIELGNAKNKAFNSGITSRNHLRPSSEVISQVGDFCRDIMRPTMAVIGQGQEIPGEEGQVSPRHLKKRVKSANSLYNQHQRQPTSPRPVIKRHTTTTARKLRAKSATTMGREVAPPSKPTRPRSAISSSAFRDFEPQNRPFPPFPAYKEKRRGKSKENGTMEVINIRHTDDELIMAPSEECENVYSKFQEKGINIPMDIITKGLMAPARKAPGTTQNQGLPISSSSGLLSHPQVWLAKEFRKLKKAERALKEAELMLAHQAEAKSRAKARAMKAQNGGELNNDVKHKKRTRKKSGKK